nr:MAG TPA: hypothetical protein [Caudoviricetes sp.]
MLSKIFLKYFCLCCVWGKNGIGLAIERGVCLHLKTC